jgi:hypothetical protein
MLSETRFDICNKALVLVGANIITSFDEATTESTVAGQLYESTLEAMLTRIRWRFATKQLQLSYQATAPLGRFKSAYQLPADALLIHTVTVNDHVIKFDRYGDKLYADTSSADTLICDYTYQTSEAEFPPYFKQCMVFELASLFAGAIARNDTLSELYRGRGLAQIAIAKATDSQAQTTRRMDVNRVRNARNRTALSNINATVSSD